MNGADLIVKCLEAEGVEYVFGYPGVAICPFYNSILESKVKSVLVRTEQNAAHAASGYTRVTGKLLMLQMDMQELRVKLAFVLPQAAREPQISLPVLQLPLPTVYRSSVLQVRSIQSSSAPMYSRRPILREPWSHLSNTAILLRM